jgi:hypothetical protein
MLNACLFQCRVDNSSFLILRDRLIASCGILARTTFPRPVALPQSVGRNNLSLLDVCDSKIGISKFRFVRFRGVHGVCVVPLSGSKEFTRLLLLLSLTGFRASRGRRYLVPWPYPHCIRSVVSWTIIKILGDHGTSPFDSTCGRLVSDLPFS